MRVERDYLRRVVQPFADGAVGLVTCPYRGFLPKGLASCLEALGIGADFIPSVLLALALEGPTFGFGSTIAVRAEALDRAGGFRAIAMTWPTTMSLPGGCARPDGRRCFPST